MTTTNRISRFTAMVFSPLSSCSPLALFAARGQGAGTAPEQAHPSRVSPANRQFILPVLDASWPMKAGKPLGEGKDEMEEFKDSASVQTHLAPDGTKSPAILLAQRHHKFRCDRRGRSSGPDASFCRESSATGPLPSRRRCRKRRRPVKKHGTKLAEIESRLRKLDDEIGAIRDAAEKEGAAEEARITGRRAGGCTQNHYFSGTGNCLPRRKSARRQLTAYAADLAVGLAQKQIHVDSATDQALVRNFAGQLGSAQKIRERTGTRPWLPSPAPTPGPSRMWFSACASTPSARSPGFSALPPLYRECGTAARMGESGRPRRSEA